MSKDIREHIVEIARLMFERHLTDLAGGNVSMRDGDTMYSTPTYAGAHQHWQISPGEIVEGDLTSDDIFKTPRFTREGVSHVYAYREFEEATAIIHAHAPWMLPFSCFGLPMEPVLKSTQTFGVLENIPESTPYSAEQAGDINRMIHQHRERITKHGAPVMIPEHGIFIVGTDLDVLLDSVERLNTNAWVLLHKPAVDSLKAAGAEQPRTVEAGRR